METGRQSPPPTRLATASMAVRTSTPGASTYEVNADLVGVYQPNALGCGGVLVTDTGDRYELSPPGGWHLEVSPLQWVDPEGRVRVRAGDQIAVNVEDPPGPGTVCMSAPTRQVTELVQVIPPEPLDADLVGFLLPDPTSCGPVLETAAGERYIIKLPEKWNFTGNPVRVISAAGDEVASSGSRIGFVGRRTDDLGSCHTEGGGYRKGFDAEDVVLPG